jgi:hypothetical protein
MGIFRKRSIFISLIAVLSMAFFTLNAQAAPPLTISPTSVAGNSAGVTVQTQAATAGGTVQINVYADPNANGVIDTNEWPFQKTVITDNMAGVPSGYNGPLGSNDDDPTSQNIATSVSFMGGIFPPGKYIVKVTDATAQSTTATFTVTAVTSVTRTVTGKVLDGTTSAAVPDALVYCQDKATGNFISAAVSGGDGSYSLQIPAAGDVKIGYQMKGYIQGPATTLTVPDAGVTGHNLYLVEPDSQVTGTVTEYGTGNPVWGANIWFEADDTYGNKLYESDAFSKGDGTYAAPTLSGNTWNVGADAPPGYFGIQNTQITPTVAGPNVVNLTAHKITAWVDSTVTAEDGTPVQGATILAMRINTSDPALMNLQSQSTTDSSGQTSVGIEAGDWNAFICTDCGNGGQVLVNGKEMVFSDSGTTYTGVLAGNHKSFTSTAYYADGALEGTVYQPDGVTPAANVGVMAATSSALNGLSQTSIGYFQTQTQTDNNGNFRLPLLGGSWSVYAQDWWSGATSPDQVINLTTNGNEVIENGETISGLSFTLGASQSNSGSISGTISYSGSQTNPIYIGVFNTPNVGPNTSPLYTTMISVPGSYTVPNLPDGTYYIGAIMTQNVSAVQMADPYGMYGIASPQDSPQSVTITGGSGQTGINFTIFDGTQQYPNPFYVPQTGSGSISGTISYSGSQNNPVDIGVFDSPNIGPDSQPLYTTQISGPGAYAISNLPDGTYYVGAIMTQDTNNIQQTDPYGMYGIVNPGDSPASVTISGGSAQTNINFTLVDGTQQYPNPFAKVIAPTKIGVFDNGYWYLDSNMSWAWDGTPTDTLGIFGVGLTGAIPVVGDWNGDGTTKIGVYINGTWYLDMNRDWQWNGEPTDKMLSFGAGLPDAVPVVGDWNGSGTTKIGIYSDGVWYLDVNGNGQWDGEAGGDRIAYFGLGLTGAVPVVGDWNGDGTTKIGVYQNGYWYLDVNNNGQWDGDGSGDTLGVFGVGLTNAVPVTGDWNADGITEIGIYQQGLWYLDKNRSWQWEGEPADQFGVFGVGLTDAIPVPGKW